MKSKFLHIFRIVPAVMLAMFLMSACSGNKDDKKELTSVHQLTTERIGVQAGTLYEEGLLEICPDVEVAFFSSPTDMLVALEQGKVDGFLVEDITYQIKDDALSGVDFLDGVVLSTPVGAAISEKTQHPMLQEQLEAFVGQLESSGVAQEMGQYWFEEFDPDKSAVDRSGITGENGIISVAVENAFEPFSYYGQGELQGYDIDLIYRFCREYGYEPEFYSVEYEAIPVGISTGKFDVGMSVIMSEERSENIAFAGPYLSIDIYTVVKGSQMEEGNFWTSLIEKFEQTFIRENRWMLFLQGAGTTILITVSAALFGTLVGFLLYMLCKKSRLINKINNFFSWLISGMPTVLLLMVLYYLVFVGWADIGGILVAIIGFTILFGYSVLEILDASVSAIEKGQEEGARALGYNANQTFFYVVMPQALRIAFPQIKSEVVSLIKETSIVGYISIADLTRMSDIVRGRTYDAFFPLITTTIIYFVLIWLLQIVVKRIEIEMTFRPIRIKKIKKGIRTKE